MKTALVYLALVGAPLLGLLGILRAGERIVPPHHVGGEWRVDAPFATALRGPCPELAFGTGGARLDVSQSGPRARLALGDAAGTTLDARLDGVTLVAATAEGSPACRGRGLRLEATLLRPDGEPQLAGAATVPGCSRCASVPFRAVRAAPGTVR